MVDVHAGILHRAHILMALHEQCVGTTDEWYTPAYIFNAMRCTFDMDVASPGEAITPWIPAREFITRDSLAREWKGLIWMNPPFGPRNGLVPWLEKFVQHGNGICLVPDRTSAPWWQRFAPKMSMILFVQHKIKFINSSGYAGNSPAQGTCLMAMGPRGVRALFEASNNDLGMLAKPVCEKLHSKEEAA